ncbi:hypothetical protein BRADI_3g09423v3 [Brachypodium distachyon]|uniref:Uncharacterized protein n=1 Tax=Brachypodium distachyon TaxID=15368 RepID=A0A0Q3J7Y0_BRADI|nr:hypothetical protein BRADI_3g09423v3 [Brachypodium distachyon]
MPKQSRVGESCKSLDTKFYLVYIQKCSADRPIAPAAAGQLKLCRRRRRPRRRRRSGRAGMWRASRATCRRTRRGRGADRALRPPSSAAAAPPVRGLGDRRELRRCQPPAPAAASSPAAARRRPGRRRFSLREGSLEADGHGDDDEAAREGEAEEHHRVAHPVAADSGDAGTAAAAVDLVGRLGGRHGWYGSFVSPSLASCARRDRCDCRMGGVGPIIN